MNAIIPRAASGAIAIQPHLPVPPVPGVVASYIAELEAHAKARARFQAATPEQREDMVVGIVPQLPALSREDQEQVRRAADALAQAVAPVQLAVLRAWLGPVNAAVRNPQGHEDFEVRCLALHNLLDDLPAGAFTSAARKTLPGFFPSAADIRQAVEPGAAKLLAMVAALNAAQQPQGQPAQPEPPRGPRTMAEIAGAKAKVKAFMAERSAAGGPAELAPVKPRHISEGHLLIVYEHLAKTGNQAAATRAAALRAKLGAPA